MQSITPHLDDSGLINNRSTDYQEEPAIYFLKEEKYEGKHPNFYNPDDFPWVKELEGKYEEIVREVQDLFSGDEKIPDALNPPYLSSPDAWKNFYFMNFKWYDHKNCLKFPKTFAILQSIPNVSFGAIAVLEPHSKVLPHIGETNAIIRCHLGLQIPGKHMDCGIMVNGEKRGNMQGKLLMFSDAHLHTTWNDTDSKRFVLIFDVIQRQFAHQSNWVCARSLSVLTLKYIDEKIRFIKSTPDLLLKVVHYAIASLWYLYLPVQKRFRFFHLTRHNDS